jgi:hypothetical protein
MAQVKEKPRPLFAHPADYERDFSEWCAQQAELVRQQRFFELDLANVVEELESMGNEQRHALASSYRLIISHLLKWQLQPQKRSRSWLLTVARERANVEDREASNKSLARKAGQLVKATYPKAVRLASIETGLPQNTFPDECPYTVEQLRDPDYMPE